MAQNVVHRHLGRACRPLSCMYTPPYSIAMIRAYHRPDTSSPPYWDSSSKLGSESRNIEITPGRWNGSQQAEDCNTAAASEGVDRPGVSGVVRPLPQDAVEGAGGGTAISGLMPVPPASVASSGIAPSLNVMNWVTLAARPKLNSRVALVSRLHPRSKALAIPTIPMCRHCWRRMHWAKPIVSGRVRWRFPLQRPSTVVYKETVPPAPLNLVWKTYFEFT